MDPDAGILIVKTAQGFFRVGMKLLKQGIPHVRFVGHNYNQRRGQG